MLEPWVIEEIRKREERRRREQERPHAPPPLPPGQHPEQTEEKEEERGPIVIDIGGDNDKPESRSRVLRIDMMLV